jgi:NAD-dependent deacetylase
VESRHEKAEIIGQAAAAIIERGHVVALTGAGISVDSGIPDFRSPGGIWERFDPMEYAQIEAFHANPEKVWKMLRALGDMVGDAEPNPGHVGLAQLERLGFLKTVITQNVDRLHQRAGNTDVVEFHGSDQYLVCLRCGKRYEDQEVNQENEEDVPRCECRAVLKPDVVFFGEPIPEQAMVRSQMAARECKVMMVVGTSAVVFPASQIPFAAKRNGATVIEVNLDATPLTNSVTDIFLKGSSSTILPNLVEAIEKTVV